jgi:hypothetical protein
MVYRDGKFLRKEIIYNDDLPHQLGPENQFLTYHPDVDLHSELGEYLISANYIPANYRLYDFTHPTERTVDGTNMLWETIT